MAFRADEAVRYEVAKMTEEERLGTSMDLIG